MCQCCRVRHRRFGVLIFSRITCSHTCVTRVPQSTDNIISMTVGNSFTTSQYHQTRAVAIGQHEHKYMLSEALLLNENHKSGFFTRLHKSSNLLYLLSRRQSLGLALFTTILRQFERSLSRDV